MLAKGRMWEGLMFLASVLTQSVPILAKEGQLGTRANVARRDAPRRMSAVWCREGKRALRERELGRRWNGPLCGWSLDSLPLLLDAAEYRLSCESGNGMPAHSPFCLLLGMVDELAQFGEGSRKLSGMWQTVMSKSGPRPEAVQLPLRNKGGSRTVHMEKAKLVGQGGRYMLMPTNIMRCVGICMPLDQWDRLDGTPCCTYIHMTGMRGSTLMMNSDVPMNEKEEDAPCRKVIRPGRMQAIAQSGKCMAQLEGSRRVEAGARNNLL